MDSLLVLNRASIHERSASIIQGAFDGYLIIFENIINIEKSEAVDS